MGLKKSVILSDYDIIRCDIIRGALYYFVLFLNFFHIYRVTLQL